VLEGNRLRRLKYIIHLIWILEKTLSKNLRVNANAGTCTGEVMQMGKVTVNAFVEPQYTVYKYGDQVPHWQIYAGLNLQF
jgi:hypothetical protein